MIYLDVTSACHSALNTGVKRIQRSMHASLKERDDYFPVCWQSTRRLYRRLDEKDFSNLEMNPGSAPAGLGLIDHFLPGVMRDALELFPRRAAGENGGPAWKAGDVLLVPDLLWDARGRFIAGLKQVRKVGVFHDAIALRHPKQSRIDHFFCQRGIRALAALDGVLCISHEAQRDLRHYWGENALNPVPIRVAPWPVPFGGNRPESRPNFDARRLLCVARFEPHKNHLALLAACEMLWRDGIQFELHLIGCLAYPDDAWRIWRRLRALRKAGYPIQWHGHVGEAELHAAYRECSATVFPSLIEGFGLPILESLWHGRPVVCGENGALGEVAGGGGCQTAEMRDPAEMTAAIRLVLTDPKRYETLFAETQKRAFRTWKDYWSSTAEFIGMEVPVLEKAGETQTSRP